MVDERERLIRSGQIHGDAVYPKLIATLQAELREFASQRQELDQKIMNRQRTLDGVLAICAEKGIQLPAELLLDQRSADAPVGFSDSVRDVLKGNGKPMGPTAVRDALVRRGVDMTKYTNPMVIVHNTLKRLSRSGEVHRVAVGDGRGSYQYLWVGPVARALAKESAIKP